MDVGAAITFVDDWTLVGTGRVVCNVELTVPVVTATRTKTIVTMRQVDRSLGIDLVREGCVVALKATRGWQAI